VTELTALATAFGAIFLVELPDKTFVATLVLSTRYRPLAVWLGVGAAFGLQTALAVLAGRAVSLLPVTPVTLAAAAIFAIGAVVLFRAAPGADEAEQQQEAEVAQRAAGQRSFLSAAWLAFLVIFAAEWGDLSQLLTISLVQRYDAGTVFVAAWAALLAVSGLAAVAGRVLLRHLRLSTVHYVGAAVCLVLAVVTLVDAVAR
jgi:putative Ca2+/H+ antiporter (TMEM165/GDT1 family)